MGKTYTGKGDDGTTGRLGGGGRSSKASVIPRVNGAFDEANSAIGLAHSQLSAGKTKMFGTLNSADRAKAEIWLNQLQHLLFRIGTDVATPLDKEAPAPRITAEDTQHIEGLVDAFDDVLPELNNFVLPTGSPSGAALHVARAMVRRAERELVAARDAGEKLNEALFPLANRLSSYLFALARWMNWRAGAPEIPPDYTPLQK